MRSVLVVGPLVALLLAACAGPPSESVASPLASTPSMPAEPVGTTAEAPETGLVIDEARHLDRSFVRTYSGQRCQAGIALARGVASVDDLLPSWATPADAGSYAANPLWNGASLVAVEVLRCATSTLTEAELWSARVAVLIEPPEWQTPYPAADSDWYELVRFSSTAELVDVMRVAGIEVEPAEVALDLLSVPNALNHAVGTVTDASRVHLEHEIVAAKSVRQVEFSRRVWREAPEGFLHEDYALQTDRIEGTATCRALPDGVLAQAMGRADCEPGTLAEVWNDTVWDGRIVYRWLGAVTA